MVNIKLVVVGKIKESFLKEEINEYLKRLSRYCKINIIEVDDQKIKENASLKEQQQVLKLEGKDLLKQIKDDEYVILLDLHGKEIDSINFAKQINQIMNRYSTITFVIGGSLGLDDELRNRANFKLCLSQMTFTHQMTRVIILEQIYRSFKINNNEIYHK